MKHTPQVHNMSSSSGYVVLLIRQNRNVTEYRKYNKHSHMVRCI